MNKEFIMLSKLLKIKYLIASVKKTKKFVELSLLIFIGTLFEMIGVGILIPILSLLTTKDFGLKYPVFRPLLNSLGNPTQVQLVIGGMVVLVAVYFLKSIFTVFLSWKQNKFTIELMAELGVRLYNGYLNLPYSFHLQRNSAFLIRNIQNDVSQFSNISQALIILSLEFFLLTGLAILFFIVEPFGSVVVSLFLIFSVFVFQRFIKQKLVLWGNQKQSLQGYLTKSLQQGFGGIKDIKILGREVYFLREYNLYNLSLSRILIRMGTLNFVPRSYMELLAIVGLAGLITILTVQNHSLESLIPTIATFVAAAFKMIPSVNRIMTSLQTLRFSSSVIDGLYDEFNLVDDSIKLINVVNHNIEFKNSIKIDELFFKYPGVNEFAIYDISLEIKKGESIGFIGPSGSGKSTLVDLILGLLSPVGGRILVDDFEINDNLRNWQKQIGYVPQTIYLTDETLRKNIAFGIENDLIDNYAVLRAVKAAQLDELVSSLELGLETVIGERGIRLSGGQRQRIGIARALYHNPEVIVLDEATSALDSVNENDVMRAISDLKGHKTILIIAHRLSTIKNCDRVYQIIKGRIVAE